MQLRANFISGLKICLSLFFAFSESDQRTDVVGNQESDIFGVLRFASPSSSFDGGVYSRRPHFSARRLQRVQNEGDKNIFVKFYYSLSRPRIMVTAKIPRMYYCSCTHAHARMLNYEPRALKYLRRLLTWKYLHRSARTSIDSASIRMRRSIIACSGAIEAAIDHTICPSRQRFDLQRRFSDR